MAAAASLWAGSSREVSIDSPLLAAERDTVATLTPSWRKYGGVKW